MKFCILYFQNIGYGGDKIIDQIDDIGFVVIGVGDFENDIGCVSGFE